MKRSLLTILWATTLAGAVVAQQSPKTQKTVPWARYNQGVHWESSLDEAFKKAEKLGKPVLLHQLVGDMKAEGC